MILSQLYTKSKSTIVTNISTEQTAHIQFTKEIKDNGKIPFLDCLDIRNNNRLQTTVYRKPNHTDRLLDKSSYNLASHKATTIRTLTRHALLVCDSHDSLAEEHKYLDNVFSKNNYNWDFVTCNTYCTEPNTTNTNLTPTTTVIIPYIKGTSTLSLGSYSLTTSMLLTDPSLPYKNY